MSIHALCPIPEGYVSPERAMACALERIAAAMERANELKQQELEDKPLAARYTR